MFYQSDTGSRSGRRRSSLVEAFEGVKNAGLGMFNVLIGNKVVVKPNESALLGLLFILPVSLV